jgi:hypothetical protein
MKIKVSARRMICHVGMAAVLQKWVHVAHTNQVAASKIVENTLRNQMMRARGRRGSLELESIF